MIKMSTEPRDVALTVLGYCTKKVVCCLHDLN